MRRLAVTACTVALCALGSPKASAAPVLWEAAFNQDGTFYNSTVALPANWSSAAFDIATGLGTLVTTITGAGSHNVLAYFDLEVDETTTGFSNEVGTAVGAAPAGLTWEIDEPGFFCLDPGNLDPRCSTPGYGDIYGNLVAGILDNANALAIPDDVSVALGWAFVLPPTKLPR